MIVVEVEQRLANWADDKLWKTDVEEASRISGGRAGDLGFDLRLKI